MTSSTLRPIATLDELFVERDAEGNVLPIEVVSDLLGRTLYIRPLTYGFVKNTDTLSIPIMDWPLERKVEILSRCIVKPDFSTFTVEIAKKYMDPMTIDHLIALVMAKSAPFKRLQGNKKGLNPLESLQESLTKQPVGGASESSTTGSTP